MTIRLRGGAQDVVIDTSLSGTTLPYALAPGWRAEPFFVRDRTHARTLLGFDANQMRMLRHALATPDGGAMWRLTDHEVLDSAAARLASGRWRAWHIICPTKPVAARPAPPPPAPAILDISMYPLLRAPATQTAGAQAQLHWIEIELVGEDGKPIPGEAYCVLLPDGSKVAGLLDANGYARLDRLPAGGACQVCFPDLDGDAWQWLESTAARG